VIGWMRRLGFVLMASGVVLLVVWAIRPVEMIWPWIRGLPLPLRIGVAAAALGLLVLVASLLAERFKEREHDRSLRHD